MRVVLSGGGTGGHIYPAAAIGRQLKREDPGTELLYIGSANGLESRIVPKLGIPFETIEISGFKRKLSLDNVRTVSPLSARCPPIEGDAPRIPPRCRRRHRRLCVRPGCLRGRQARHSDAHS